MELYDNFSDKSKLILEQAFTEVSAMNMNYVGSEHLLLSMLKIKSEILDTVKRYNRLTYKDVKKECLRFVGIGLVAREIQGYSRRASEILKLATFEANSLKSLKVEPEHIFLALLDQNESTAVKILEKIGFSAFDIKTDIIRELDLRDKKKSQKKKAAIEGSFLERFGIDMTKRAKDKGYDPVLERDDESERLIQILGRRQKNNPCLIGEPGVGKTAIVEGVVQKMILGQVPDYLLDKKVYAISLGALLSGSKFRGEFEDRLMQLISEVKDNKNIILFIDEIHTLVGAGATQGAMDAANLLKPFLSRDDIQIIGATTITEYRKYIEKDKALERRLQPVMVNEPSVDACIRIIRGIKSQYESYHQLKISDEAVTLAVQLSARFLTDRFLPDKAIDLLDEAASRGRIEKLEDLPTGKLYEVVHLWSGIPMNHIEVEDDLGGLSAYLKEHIKGQDHAVESITRAIMRSKVGLSDQSKPLASFMLMGPTGVGKTALIKKLTEHMFGDEKHLIRFDMSEFVEKHSVSKLIGSPPGYVAYEEGGRLTEKVRTKPYSVILFDEIEKAHPDVVHVFLQLLDEGVLTDGKGRQVDFKNTIVVFTSNLGIEVIKKKTIGFETSEFDLEEALTDELRKYYQAEFINRIDEIVVFKPLEKEAVMAIIDFLMDKLKNRLEELGYDLKWSHAVRNQIYRIGYSETYGVRSLKRAMTKLIENPLSEYILKHREKYVLYIDVDQNDVIKIDESVRKA